MTDDDRKYMGTAADAKAALIAATVAYRECLGPRIDTAKGHKAHDAKTRERGNRLQQAALLWLWHEENPLNDGGAS